ncbi:MAG: hypothetical protein U5R06_04200 [candidate division KSB1 bacterium]|nr:hypothetical protein [candidate division KSB1 bacterium]
MKIVYYIALLIASNVGAQTALIWEPSGVTGGSGSDMNSALSSQGVTGTLRTASDLSGVTLGSYDYVFVCLGADPNNRVLDPVNDSADIAALVDYLDNGGALYMEGGDTWAYDDVTDLHVKFQITGLSDGTQAASLDTVRGANNLRGLDLEYSGPNAYIDRLAPKSGAFIVHNNNNPEFACGIAFDSGTYRTIGASFLFGGLVDGASITSDVMADYLDFFDNGYAGKPAPPRNVRALQSHNLAVPLVWDAPVGSAPIERASSTHMSEFYTSPRVHALSFTTINAAPDQDIRQFNAPDQEQEAMLEDLQSYTVYRSTGASGPFSVVATGSTRQFYRDASVTNGQLYYYKITAQYASGESDDSYQVHAAPQAQGRQILSGFTLNPPTLDGNIDAAEWSEADSVAITSDGIADPVKLFMMNDQDYLYVAVRDESNTAQDIDDQLALYLDADQNRAWPSSGTSEGNVWIRQAEFSAENQVRSITGFWPRSLSFPDTSTDADISQSSDLQSGQMHYEMKFDLANSMLNAAPGDELGLYISALDAASSTTTGIWPSALQTLPQDDPYLIPALYGDLILSDVPVFSETLNISSAGNYTFNDPGDGHEWGMNVTALDGSGDVTLTQTNTAYTPLPCTDEIPLYWTLEVPASINSYTADVEFHYTDADAAGFEESAAYWGVAWLNESAKVWIWLGGTIDASANTVTINISDKEGVFVLYRRIFSDYDGNGYVDGVDLQQFGDSWHAEGSPEFDLYSREQFFNCGYGTQGGVQIIDGVDLQVFGDSWHNGIQP